MKDEVEKLKEKLVKLEVEVVAIEDDASDGIYDYHLTLESIDKILTLFQKAQVEAVRAAREAEHNWLFDKFGDVDELPLREFEMIQHEANARLKEDGETK